MSQLPNSSTQPGWPEFLEDNHGDRYVRLRDGVGTGDFTGHACQYGLVDPETGMIVRKHLYLPTMGSTLDDLVMSGGSWMEPEAMVAAGIPPIEFPEEPIRFPRTLNPS